MQRTIEKLAGERQALQERLQRELDELKSVASALENLEGRLTESPPPPSSRGTIDTRRPLPDSPGVRAPLAEAVGRIRALAVSMESLLRTVDALAEAREKEWNALENNHLGMIFKSMEWRVEKLAAAYEDVSALFRTFVPLQDRLGRLQAALEAQALPSPAEVKEILEPLRDWRYSRFENRHRGNREEIRSQQERYLAFFPPGGRILDLGCGRGEFLELLRERGFRGQGVDVNAQMVGSCLDKGLDARRADLLTDLAARPDASLDGLFSAQVIEHLSPAAVERLVELAFAKLAPGGVAVLETIDPTSVFSLVQVFFLDMSHRVPVHPRALEFLLEAAGFEGVEIVAAGDLAAEKLRSLPGIDPASTILNDDIDRLNRLLYGPPMYAAVGRKKR